MTHFILGFIVGGLVTVGVVAYLFYRSFLKDMKVYK